VNRALLAQDKEALKKKVADAGPGEGFDEGRSA
jgi:isoquinoline 1-oxidoreductase beta subunit